MTREDLHKLSNILLDYRFHIAATVVVLPEGKPQAPLLAYMKEVKRLSDLCQQEIDK